MNKNEQNRFCVKHMHFVDSCCFSQIIIILAGVIFFSYKKREKKELLPL